VVLRDALETVISSPCNAWNLARCYAANDFTSAQKPTVLASRRPKTPWTKAWLNLQSICAWLITFRSLLDQNEAWVKLGGNSPGCQPVPHSALGYLAGITAAS
jgi:hypothetical protein